MFKTIGRRSFDKSNHLSGSLNNFGPQSSNLPGAVFNCHRSFCSSPSVIAFRNPRPCFVILISVYEFARCRPGSRDKDLNPETLGVNSSKASKIGHPVTRRRGPSGLFFCFCLIEWELFLRIALANLGVMSLEKVKVKGVRECNVKKIV